MKKAALSLFCAVIILSTVFEVHPCCPPSTPSSTTSTTSTSSTTISTSTISTASTSSTSTRLREKRHGGSGHSSSVIDYLQRAKIVSSCFDGEVNYGESDVDCGGPCVGKCGVGERCIRYSDCVSRYCSSGVCKTPTCFDGLRNQNELGVDCGGPCRRCPSCSDGLMNQGEERVDCGGPCRPCCPLCSTCLDGVLNQDESDVDCGGPCKPCLDSYKCRRDSDCVSRWCSINVCVTPSCSDGLMNQGEERVDCGGPCISCGGEGVGVVGYMADYDHRHPSTLILLLLLILASYFSYRKGRWDAVRERESYLIDDLLEEGGI